MSYSDYIARIQLGHQLSAALKRAEEAEARAAELETALASQQPDDDGWIEWAGGECPVPEFTVVDVRYRDGAVSERLMALRFDTRQRDASYSFWLNQGFRNDIVAYRVVKP